MSNHRGHVTMLNSRIIARGTLSSSMKTLKLVPIVAWLSKSCSPRHAVCGHYTRSDKYYKIPRPPAARKKLRLRNKQSSHRTTSGWERPKQVTPRHRGPIRILDGRLESLRPGPYKQIETQSADGAANPPTLSGTVATLYNFSRLTCCSRYSRAQHPTQ